MKSLFVLCLALMALLPLPARAITLTLVNSDTADITLGDVFDQVIVTDTSHLDLTGGILLEDATFLDLSTGNLVSAQIDGFLEVYDESTVTLHADNVLLAGLPIAAGTVIDSTTCLLPSCQLTGTFEGGAEFSIDAQILKFGTVTVVAVPEPSPMLLVGLGLLGLGWAGRARWSLAD